MTDRMEEGPEVFEGSEEQAPESEETEYIEFLGTDPQHGTTFYGTHTVSKKYLKDAWGVDTPKDLTWAKQEGGPRAGRMLVPVSDMSPEAAEGLAKDRMFRRVTLSN